MLISALKQKIKVVLRLVYVAILSQLIINSIKMG